jgi:hypothetical protein
MVTMVNRAKMKTATTGTGTITLSTAADGFQTFAAAGLADGDTVHYVIEELYAWEIGAGIYAAAGPTLTRDPTESSNAGAAITLAGNALVYVSAHAADIVQPSDIGVTVQGYSAVLQNTTAVFTSALNTKLAGIEAGATADQTAAEILTAIKTVDGAASGLDADLLDGQHGSYYQPASTAITTSNIGSQSVSYAATAGNATTATTADRAYPKRVGNVDLNFNWSGQSGQPPWLWGGSDGSNMYVYNPSNFSVSYATTAGSVAAPGAGAVGSYALMIFYPAVASSNSSYNNAGPNTLIAGGSLSYASANGSYTGVTAGGTWRLMGSFGVWYNAGQQTSLFVRIS